MKAKHWQIWKKDDDQEPGTGPTSASKARTTIKELTTSLSEARSVISELTNLTSKVNDIDMSDVTNSENPALARQEHPPKKSKHN
jgi:hypothetical protein